VKDFQPSFLALSKIEENLLVSRLEAARKAISHAGEKGRSLEAEVTTLLRSFLPQEYGLTTGFVVYHAQNGPALSSQLDIIIYDPIRSGPIAKLAICDVLPLEAVYGYVEVKSSIQSTSDSADKFADNSIEMCLKKNQRLRSMTERRFWSPSVSSNVKAGPVKHDDWTAIRSYIFAFEAEGVVAKNPALFAQRIADVSANLGPPVHLHGVFVAGQAYYVTQPVDARIAKPADYHHIKYTTKRPLAAFKWSLIHDLARFPRFPKDWTPAVDNYNEEKIAWKSCAPQRDKIKPNPVRRKRR
jgi:hypothetical protein